MQCSIKYKIIELFISNSVFISVKDDFFNLNIPDKTNFI